MNIQTESFKLDRKSNKQEIQNLLEVQYKNAPNDVIKHQLAIMYKYFMPAIPKKTKTLEQWVFKAVSSDATREYLTLSYSDGENLVATDGHRLHMIPTTLPIGFYDMNGEPIEFDGNFPDYKRVVPAEGKTITVDFTACDISKVGLHKTNFLYLVEFPDMKVGLHKTRVDEVLNGETTAVLTIPTNPTSPVLFTFSDRKAVIMPTRF